MSTQQKTEFVKFLDASEEYWIKEFVERTPASVEAALVLNRERWRRDYGCDPHKVQISGALRACVGVCMAEGVTALDNIRIEYV